MSAMSELHLAEQEREAASREAVADLLLAVEKALRDLQGVSKHPVIADVVRELRAAIKDVEGY
jgi:hypothetical protein